jgi:hypothetical protein
MANTRCLAAADLVLTVGSIGGSYDNTLLQSAKSLTKPKSSGGNDLGRLRHPSRWSLLNGSTGSTITACSNPSAISHPQKPKPTDMPQKSGSKW